VHNYEQRVCRCGVLDLLTAPSPASAYAQETNLQGFMQISFTGSSSPLSHSLTMFLISTLSLPLTNPPRIHRSRAWITGYLFGNFFERLLCSELAVETHWYSRSPPALPTAPVGLVGCVPPVLASRLIAGPDQSAFWAWRSRATEAIQHNLFRASGITILG